MPAVPAPPSDRTPPPKDLEIRPKAVRAWLESLPTAQVADTARKVIAHAAALNRARMDNDDRVQILEAYRPVTAVLFDELDAVYSKATVPLGAKAREALTLARDLAGQVAVGYRVAIAERGGKLLAFGAKKQLPLLVLRAMEHYAMLLRAAYKSYTPVPEGLWRDMHQLYLDAERERVAAEIVDADTKEAVVNVYVEGHVVGVDDLVDEIDEVKRNARRKKHGGRGSSF